MGIYNKGKVARYGYNFFLFSYKSNNRNGLVILHYADIERYIT